MLFFSLQWLDFETGNWEWVTRKRVPLAFEKYSDAQDFINPDAEIQYRIVEAVISLRDSTMAVYGLSPSELSKEINMLESRIRGLEEKLF
jgi:hypothetical protein